MIDAGSTFQVGSPGSSLDTHLWIVVSEPSVAPDTVVIVNFTSWSEDEDQGCVVKLGEHPFVRHKTCVKYVGAKLTSAQQLKMLIGAGKLRPNAAVSSKLLERIRQGAAKSEYFPLGYRRILEDQGLVDT